MFANNGKKKISLDLLGDFEYNAFHGDRLQRFKPEITLAAEGNGS